MGMGIKHRIGNGNGREWETSSVGMGITCTPMGTYSQGFYADNGVLLGTYCNYYLSLIIYNFSIDRMGMGGNGNRPHGNPMGMGISQKLGMGMGGNGN